MARKTRHNPERREFKGRSYKRWGKLWRIVRDAVSKRLAIVEA